MAHTERNIVDAYSGLLNGLSIGSKRKLIERLSASLKENRKDLEKAFYDSFGGFASDMSAEDIVADIRASRSFRKRDVSF
jgi:hypothetical protein